MDYYLARQVLQYLVVNRSATVTELARLLYGSSCDAVRKRIERILHKLVRAGILVKQGRHYILPDYVMFGLDPEFFITVSWIQADLKPDQRVLKLTDFIKFREEAQVLAFEEGINAHADSIRGFFRSFGYELEPLFEQISYVQVYKPSRNDHPLADLGLDPTCIVRIDLRHRGDRLAYEDSKLLREFVNVWLAEDYLKTCYMLYAMPGSEICTWLMISLLSKIEAAKRLQDSS